MLSLRRSLVSVVLLLAFIGAPAFAQGQRPMTLVDLMNVPQLSGPQLSPDGRQVVYAVSTADWKNYKRIAHLWRIKADGTDPVLLTNGPDGESAPRWSPDGRGHRPPDQARRR